MQLITGTVQPYPWGSTTAIPEFLGQAADGQPQAEYWLGAHPAAPSRVGEEPLTSLISADPVGVLGSGIVDQFGPKLPYLLKVLAADQPLSLQAHPTRVEADAGYAAENRAGIALDDPRRVFRDDWPKPEMMVALTTVTRSADFGIRPTRTPCSPSWRSTMPSGWSHRCRTADSVGLREVFGRLLRLTESERSLVAQVIAAAAELTPVGSGPGLLRGDGAGAGRVLSRRSRRAGRPVAEPAAAGSG